MNLHDLLFGAREERWSFKNQLDLVNHLILNKNTKYFVSPSDNPDAYNKMQGRLKTYVSQLLSENTIRAATDEFKEGFRLVLEEKLSDPGLASLHTQRVIEAIQKKNDQISKAHSLGPAQKKFLDSIKTANYVAIITSKPLEVEANFDIDSFSMRNVFFKDFFQTLHNNETFKHYRFNFPLDSYATVFWVGIRKVLFRYLLANRNDFELFKNLYDNYGDFSYSKNDASEVLKRLTDAILTRLNKERLIMVFVVDTPVYTLPLVAINPVANKDFELFSFMDAQGETPNVYQFSPTDSILWRLFVWDKLKDNRYTGKSVSYESVMES